ncbi:unnamed protein product [Aphanomyces euteiches]|uniref:FYVE-type domain-containing protein n=1 Tax=Aphanomyces euteiches TaxID=100861 RepID=A0A6G0WLS8_9STRA|nr:hypothetical protein Ae201684_013843 [Aphanomyces euteiches]KAH9080849.1 hypothetical protein Ae201684P_007935 [Aphanomyces euteiches]KAH9151272.1 hypothetical protein AeRB84_006082 [Aphanomyces euteiches]
MTIKTSPDVIDHSAASSSSSSHSNQSERRQRHSFGSQSSSSTSNSDNRRRRHSAGHKHDIPSFRRTVTLDAPDLIAAGADAVETLIARSSGRDGTQWLVTKNPTQGVTLSKGTVPGYGHHHAHKATGRVECSAVHLAKKLKDPTCVKQYDDHIQVCNIVEEVDLPSYTTIQYSQGLPAFPATARDYCVVTSERRLDSHVIVIAARSIDHPLVAYDPAFVRAEVHVSGYIIRPLSANACAVTVVRHQDVHGMAPSFVANKADGLIKLVEKLRKLYSLKKGSTSSDDSFEESWHRVGVEASDSASSGNSNVAEESAEPAIDEGIEFTNPNQQPEPDATCACCGRDVTRGYNHHTCMTCHHVVCGDCSSHRIKTKKWNVLRLCDNCYAIEHKDDESTTTTDEPSKEIVVVQIEVETPNAKTNAGGILAYGAIVSSVIWLELSAGMTMVLIAGLSILAAMHMDAKAVSSKA